MSALKDAPDGQVELITHSTEEACDSDGIQSRQVWFIRERLWILRTYCYTRARLSCKRSTCLTRVWTLKFGPALNVVNTSSALLRSSTTTTLPNMSSRAAIVNVEPLEPIGKLTDKLAFKVAFEAFEDLPEEIDFSVMVTWDGHREHDQILDVVQAGPLKAGKYKFTFEVAKVPDYSKVKDEDVTDSCLLLLSASYRGSCFSKVGFFVSHEYQDQVLSQEPPSKPLLEKLVRKISTKDARITTIPIKWGDEDDFVPLEKLPAEESSAPIAV